MPLPGPLGDITPNSFINKFINKNNKICKLHMRKRLNKAETSTLLKATHIILSE
jgi:hypothetical protein